MSQTASPPGVPGSPEGRGGFLVTALCWAIVVFDGYDLIVYGTVLPRLLEEPGWGLTAAGAGLLGSLAFAGMLVGALGAGVLSDRLGRRRTVLACTAWFSVFTVLCAAATGPAVFGTFRFLAGIGLGGLVPSANALAAEFVAPRYRSLVSTLMMSGVPIGGSIAAVTGMWAIPAFGWRSMFVAALLGVVVVLPLCWWLLPESAAFHRSRGRDDRAREVERRFGLVPDNHEHAPDEGSPGIAGLLTPRYLRASTLFALATLATLFAWYGLATWLPELMQKSGFDLGSSLTFLLALSLGAVAGSLVTAWAGDRYGPLPTGIAAATTAGASLALITTHPPNAITYVLLMLAGVGTHGTQCLIIAAVTHHFPPRLRGSALGWALGVGRIGAVVAPQAGGLLLAAGLGVNSNFLVFTVAALVAGGLLWLCPRPSLRTQPDGETRIAASETR